MNETIKTFIVIFFCIGMKKGIRILSIDDSPFKKEDIKDLVVGIVSRGELVEGVISFYVDVDGIDATEKIIKKVKGSRFFRQIKLIALNGITLAGLNIVDITKLNSELKIPVIALTRKKPSKKKLELAIKKAGKNVEEKILSVEKIDTISKSARIGPFYVQYIGLNKKELVEFLDSVYSMLRLAHLIGSGVVKGESSGRM